MSGCPELSGTIGKGGGVPIFTIGHSTRTVGEFVELLRAGEVSLVVDVRRVPRSRTNPQYNADVLAAELASSQIGYTRIAELGGLRKKLPVPEAINAFWENRRFHNYADYAMSEEFDAGFRQLLELSCVRRTAVMCAEAVWWRCHRRIVADYLINAGRPVFHLMSERDVKPASMTGAAVSDGRHLRYPA